MQALQTLAAQAIVGTERQAPTLPELPGAVGETLTALPQDDPAQTLLRAAGLLSVCALAGHVPAPVSTPAAAVCRPDNLPHGEDSSLAGLLQSIIDDGPVRLQFEALRLLQGGCLPYRILPKALELGRGSRALRPPLLAVLGQRGQWLARQNPDWAYAVGADEGVEDAWETGSLEQRLIHLRQTRQTDPARGRDLLAQTLAESGAKERNELLAVLAEGLGADDEDLLESVLLKDRGKEVRQTAAALLSRLPDSRYVARMAGRVDACLSQRRKLLRQVWVLEPPETFDADWRADGLEEAKPQHTSLGPRAWWLQQLTRALPLSWWTTRTGMTPLELLDWAKDGEWRDGLWRGWLERQTLAPDPDWAEAFLARLANKVSRIDPFAMIQTLPPTRREHHWLAALRQTPPPAGFGALLRQLLLSLPADTEPLSAGFCRSVLALVAEYMTAKFQDYYLRETLSEFACLMPPELFEEAQALWASIPDTLPSYGAASNRFPVILEQRRSLHSHPLLTRP